MTDAEEQAATIREADLTEMNRHLARRGHTVTSLTEDDLTDVIIREFIILLRDLEATREELEQTDRRLANAEQALMEIESDSPVPLP